MKRPDGFDPTVRERGPRREASPVERSASDGTAASPAPAMGDEQETDVLDLDAARLREPASTEQQEPKRKPPKGSTSTSKSTPKSSRAAERTTDEPSAPEEAFLDPREAARRRRRHERQEIRRFTARKRGRHRAWWLTAAILGALVLVSLAGAYSPLMAVRAIEVVGATRVDQAEITQALDDQLGRPLALVDAGAVKAVLVGYPLIASYSLESQPPSTLVVRIVEREPVGVLQSGTVYTLVDAAGVTIERSDQPIVGYPTLMVSGGATSKGFVAAAAVVRALPADLRARVASVSATTADDVTLTLVDSPAEVVWGSAHDSALKALSLARVMAATDPSQVNQYDVSSPSSAIVR